MGTLGGTSTLGIDGRTTHWDAPMSVTLVWDAVHKFSDITWLQAVVGLAGIPLQ